MSTDAPCRKAKALEIEIERAWYALTRSPRPRAVYLSDVNALFYGEGEYEDAVLVGTFDSGIHLQDFREEVFFVHQHRRPE